MREGFTGSILIMDYRGTCKYPFRIYNHHLHLGLYVFLHKNNSVILLNDEFLSVKNVNTFFMNEWGRSLYHSTIKVVDMRLLLTRF